MCFTGQGRHDGCQEDEKTFFEDLKTMMGKRSRMEKRHGKDQ
jgi:hypothetical protein